MLLGFFQYFHNSFSVNTGDQSTETQDTVFETPGLSISLRNIRKSEVLMFSGSIEKRSKACNGFKHTKFTRKVKT